MRWRLLGLLAGAALFPSSAAADPVVLMGAGGKASVRNDPYLTVPAITPAPMPSPARRPHARRARIRGRLAGTAALAANARHRRSRRKHRKTVGSELRRLYHAGSITGSQYGSYVATWNSALKAQRRLHGTRELELESVIQNMQTFATGGVLIPSRLPALFLTLARNQQYWSTGPLLSYGQRVEFAGSQLVWEYYPGQGIELTALGNFGKADGLYTAGRSQYPTLQELLGEMIPLAVDRGGGLTWEYYFKFEGGSPPWTSAMSQGTAIEALTRGYQALKRDKALADVDYLGIAHQALPIFTVRPPVGVAVPTARGTRFVQYSFASSRKDEVINAFLQSVIGLYDYSQASGDPLAASLFNAGNAEAEAEVPSFDTGAWSLYQPGQEDTLDYHELVIGFLQQLCSRTAAAVYCNTAQNFETDLKTPPTLTLLTTRARVRRSFPVHFRLSKISHVGIVLLRGTKIVFETSAYFPYGTDSFSIPPIKRKGSYTVDLAATDLAGNFSRIVGTLVLRR